MVLFTYVFTTALITPAFLIPHLIPLAKLCICKKTPTRWIFKDFKIDLLSSLTPVIIYLRFDLCYYWSVCICAIHLPQISPLNHTAPCFPPRNFRLEMRNGLPTFPHGHNLAYYRRKKCPEKSVQ